MSTRPGGPLPDQPAMTDWFNPLQLARTGVEVILSTIFGRFADQRLIQALSAGTAAIYDFSGPDVQPILLEESGREAAGEALRGVLDAAAGARTRAVAAQLNLPPDTPATPPGEDLWIDYAADVGDGWDSTYAVASTMRRQPGLVLAPPGSGPTVTTHPGRILVFGGDQVYPVASAEDYEQRLVAAYRAAFGDGPYPMVFAVPGNHDWYDNLASFSRLFCSRQPFAGPPVPPGKQATGCPTPQRRSYFALKLPYGWWLLGTDVQLGSDIDGPQYNYFEQVTRRMADGDRVILCTPEPHWVYADTQSREAPPASKRALDTLEELLGGRVRVFIAGDAHQFCRYEAGPDADPERKTHKITCGGGGAFVHPTHGQLDVSTLAGGFRKAACYPPRRQSWLLGCWNLLFPLWNPWFGLVTAVCYLLILWLLMPALEDHVVPVQGDFGLVAGVVRPGLYTEPNFLTVLWRLFADPDIPTTSVVFYRVYLIAVGLVIWLAFLLFTEVGSRPRRVISSLAHATAQYAAVIFLAWMAARLANVLWPYQPDYLLPTFWQPGRFLFATAFVFAGGWLLGSWIMGLYLFVSANFFRQQWNAAFSAIKVQDWKSFLRLRIDPSGTLTIYPVGIRRVPRAWQWSAAAAAGPAIVPAGPEVAAELIEPPVVVRK